MSPTSDPDPADPVRDAVLWATAAARESRENTVRQATASARLAAERAMLEAAQAAVSWVSRDPNALIVEQTRQAVDSYLASMSRVDLTDLQDRIRTSYPYSTDSMARAAIKAAFTSASYGQTASSLAMSTMVRLAADPALSDVMRPSGGTTVDGPGPSPDGTAGTAEDVQRIAAAQLNQVTGGQAEGWRWLLLTREGRETLVLILTVVGVLVAVGSFVQDFVNNLQDGQPTVEVDNSPGSTINITSSPDGDDQPSVSVKDSPGATVNVAPSPDEDERRDVPPETCGP